MVAQPLLSGDWLSTINALFQMRTPVMLLQEIIQVDPGTNQVLLYVQGVLSGLCSKAQIMAQTHSIPEAFMAPTLKAIAEAVENLPDLVEMLVHGFFSENLHRFLADHPIPTLMRMFPAPFCVRTEILENYFNVTTKQSMVMSGLCSANWTNFMNEVMMEMIPQETFAALAMNQTVNLAAAWNSTGCMARSLLMTNWTNAMGVHKLMRTFRFIEQNLTRALYLMPRTQALLQLYLQPFLQGYPEFLNFPNLYHHMREFTIAFDSMESLEDVLHAVEQAAEVVREFLNVNMTQAFPELIQVKPIAGEIRQFQR